MYISVIMPYVSTVKIFYCGFCCSLFIYSFIFSNSILSWLDFQRLSQEQWARGRNTAWMGLQSIMSPCTRSNAYLQL